MSRITNKKCYRYEDFIFSLRNELITPNEIDNSIYKKLKILEDIEEELGIDLITLFKATKEGIYYKNTYHYIYKNTYHYIYYISKTSLCLEFNDEWELWVKNHSILEGLLINLKDYGKTWALTKEELENDN